MTVSDVALVVAAALTIPTAAFGQNCDCAHWPWEPPPGCNAVCGPALEQRLPVYQDPMPRANEMVADVVEQAYDVRLRTNNGDRVPSSQLHDDPEALGWADVSGFPSRVGAVAVWPSTSGFVARDADGEVLVWYPSLGGGWAEGNARSVQDGVEPRYVVPRSILTDEAGAQLNQRP